MSLDFSAIEVKWQKAWYESRVNESEPEPGRDKFFMIFAYPGVTGYLHVGHMRGYTVSDAIVRYKRMTGHNVLFPMGTHATGNGAISFARRVERGDPDTVGILRANGCDDATIESLKEPAGVVTFFNRVYLNDYWMRFGFLSDWRRFTSTINPDYSRFIEWQMLKLKAKGLLIQKPYYAPACMEHGPVAIDASETDISKGGAAEVLEYTLLKFDFDDGRKLVAATLRPETVFGLTNFWVNPEVEYVNVKVDDETWVVSVPAVEKLKLQKDSVEVLGPADGASLMGERCRAPFTGRTIPIFPSSLCDPEVGTGLVMSVPSDAPVDWVALMELGRDSSLRERYRISDELLDEAKPVAIIDTPGYGPMPAVEITERMRIESLDDPKLEEATKEAYRTGFHRGRMNDNCGPYSGKPVEEAKEQIREEMLSQGGASLMYDLSEEVRCRCGERVLVKKIPDQWFIDYANPALKERSKEHAKSMHIFPKEYYDNIQNVIEWYRERACVRLGNWLGTRFPLDRRWIVEAIADSTLYPIYYVISRYANEGEISAEQMGEEFFDYVLLGEGESSLVSERTGIAQQLLDRIRSEFEYWYPLDVNLGGKEHMTVHFPVFLMNHVAVLRPEHWPRGVVVNWYITSTGGKISKSKGGAQPIPDAAERFGVDAMRLFYAHIASLYVDVAWEDDKVGSYRDRLDRTWYMFRDIMSRSADAPSEMDAWLIARLQTRIKRLHESMSEYDLRSFVNEVYFEVPQDFRWYIKRGGCDGPTLRHALERWVPLMAPVTPHIAEELWALLGKEGFVSQVQLPEGEVTEEVVKVEARERLVERLVSDVAEILKVTAIKPKRLVLMVAPRWKADMVESALAMPADLMDMAGLIKSSMSKAVDVPGAKKEVPSFAKELVAELSRASEEERRAMSIRLDELAVLTSARGFLEGHFGCSAEVFAGDDPDRYDPKGKARFAKPGRPAIYVE